MARKTRQIRPATEGLEERYLLSPKATLFGKPINDKDLQHYIVQKENNVPVSDRRLYYTTPDGAKVIVTLYGFGSLKGTTVDPNTGALNLVYNGTTSGSKIIGKVYGGNGYVPLASVRDADTAPRSASSTGVQQVGVVNLSKFDLISGGFINLTGGTNYVVLDSMAGDTAVYLKDIPTSNSSTSTTTTTTTTGSVGTGGAPVVGGNTGGAVATAPSTSATAKPVAPGVEVHVRQVNAGPLGTPPLGPPQVFGFDPTADALLRFDATTGDLLQSIPVGGLGGGQPISGVGLGRAGNDLVVLIGSGSTIRAFNAVTGAAAGQFSVANLSAIGFNSVAGIGSTDTRTVVIDPTAGTNGLAAVLNITASLATGEAVVSGAPFAPGREFNLSGGATGIPGSDVIYATGSAHFDPFQPDKFQSGVLAFTTAKGVTAETARTAFGASTSAYVNVVPPDQGGPQNQALGSIDGDLALVTAVTNGHNVVTLINPSTLVPDGVVALNNPNQLVGLSESFHPELVNAAIVDVQGDLKNFVAQRATGLVINDRGSTNLIAIQQATDTTVIGNPLLHVAIPVRRNVQLISTSARIGTDKYNPLIQRPGTRGGVTINKRERPAGPLTLP